MSHAPSWVTILSDLRLTADSRVCALYLLSLGTGEHEVSFLRWTSLLNNASRERVREALGLLAEFGIATRHHGGSRADRYELTGGKQPVNDLSDGKRPVKQNLTGEKQPLKLIRGAENNRSKPRARDAVPPADAPPPAPAETRARAEHPIDPKAEAALDERFAGCRGSIRDALRHHVPPSFHRSFVMSLLAYIQLTNRLTDAKGKTVPADQVPALIAKTLNELGPEIANARNPTRKVTANLQGIARRMNDVRRQTNGRQSATGGFTQEEFDALPG